PHWKDLENCMNDVRSRPTAQPESPVDHPSSGYYTPKTLRQANEIREWQARLKARRARYHRMQLRITCSSSEIFK
ncbi:MAG: serine/threonine protein kinase, partial [Leptodesmis sp.]